VKRLPLNLIEHPAKPQTLPRIDPILLPCVVAGSLDRDAGDQAGLVAGTFWGWNTLLLPPFKKERVVSNTGTQALDVQT